MKHKGKTPPGQDDFSTKGGPKEKSEGARVPPGHDTTKFNKNMELAESLVSSLGPVGEAALAETIDTIKNNPETMADPQMFFAALERSLERQLTEHGVAIPPEGFDKVEQALDDQIDKSEHALDDQIDKIKQDLDSMSEISEMESLRLQMAMDRMSKMISMLSNVMKKMSDTASQITQNLK